ncbi:Serine/threonine kinase PKN8 [Enhygromyxa salina]|uniref:Serine/threonine kinase PKN8 n=1 Tax=Enhygromyxa salina TaxID=215803 RepID=A0A0C2CUB8_9BACT|nr:serine/threonine-protein kinase [Enhygromyxa salina]KIG13195.1 Serine/threonine kinase PKN8 [Enhygromyxa salina]
MADEIAQEEATDVAEDGVAPALTGARSRMAVPERIGRYVVLRQLGAGAMGVVVVAYDPELDRQVAIKLIHPRVAERGDARARMLREAKAMARLSHPNVVQIYDAGTIDGRVFIAMELVDGGPLSSWREAQARSADEILAVYIAAGRGLAAAHDAGLVHRDFKPDNVLVDRDGRARVLDFGLVRADTELIERPSQVSAPIGTEPTLEISLAGIAESPMFTRDHESSGAFGSQTASELDLELTHGGQIMGTPAYMSPEQWTSAKADARSDQFSFCVALWEALYEQRPFQGRTIQALAGAITSGVITEPERPVQLTRRLRAALERGLSADPAARFETMHALLRELSREDSSRWSVPLAWVALVAFGVLAWGRFASVGIEAEPPPPPSCERAGEAITKVWNPARRESVAAAFKATQLPVSPILTKLDADLEDYNARWLAQATDNCEATRIRQQQSEQLLDQRARCLDAKLQALDALLEVFTQADESTVDQALLAVESLPKPSACEADRVSEASPVVALDPVRQTAVSEGERQLSRMRASLDTGRYDEAIGRMDPVQALVEELDHPPLTAAFLVERGRLLARIDQREEGVAALQRGFYLATQLRDDLLALSAATWLAEIEGAQRLRPEFAQLWADQARALLERESGRYPEAEADLADTVSWNAYLRDDLDAARAEAERGLALLDDAKLPAPMRRMALLLDRGAAEYRAGDLAEAEATFTAALEIATQTVGRDNANATGALNNLAVTYSAEGEYERARALLQESIETRERALGRDNTSVGVGLSNLADIELELGHGPEALAAVERGYSILLAALGPDQYATVIAQQRLGLARAMVGQHEDAILDLRGALASAEDPAGPDPSLAQELRAELVVVLGLAGHDDQRDAELEQVRAADPQLWREVIAAGRFAAWVGQVELADALLSMGIERAGDPSEAGSRRSLALGRLELAELLLDSDPAHARSVLGGDLERDLSSAPKLAKRLADLRRRAGQ